MFRHMFLLMKGVERRVSGVNNIPSTPNWENFMDVRVYCHFVFLRYWKPQHVMFDIKIIIAFPFYDDKTFVFTFT